MKKKYNSLQMFLYPILYIGIAILILRFIILRDYKFTFNVDLDNDKISSAVVCKDMSYFNRLDLRGYSFSSPDELIIFNSTAYDETTKYLSYNDVTLTGVIHSESCMISTKDTEKYFSLCFEVSTIESSSELINPQVLWAITAYDIETGDRIETYMNEQGSIDCLAVNISEIEYLENVVLVFSAVPMKDNNEKNLFKYLSDVTESDSKMGLVKLSDLL